MLWKGKKIGSTGSHLIPVRSLASEAYDDGVEVRSTLIWKIGNLSIVYRNETGIPLVDLRGIGWHLNTGTRRFLFSPELINKRARGGTILDKRIYLVFFNFDDYLSLCYWDT
ncbi:hypothetical protein NPIL_178851 [Nephila pilipes]|uniref:Uncharacterized protein n=1 Tax=Nephila pilipes TaxID=299642 RepID=A0A8X6NC85_NEPPI|nr:hypothetical protein NPIL_178851 [Nephila pilipes]